jgi:hypothetical protein
MMIAPSYQRRGIGTRMLWEASKFMHSAECFCLPHAWLEGFYGISDLPGLKTMTLRHTFGKG